MNDNNGDQQRHVERQHNGVDDARVEALCQRDALRPEVFYCRDETEPQNAGQQKADRKQRDGAG
jgi:hypothetical protein